MSYSEMPIVKDSELLKQNARALYDFVKRETYTGRPCVLWGAYVPEFAVAIGCHDDQYHVASFKCMLSEPEPPIPILELDLVCIHYALAFPAQCGVRPEHRDRQAVYTAARLLTQRSDQVDYSTGQAGYATWIAALEANTAHTFGNSYNAQCWQEMRHHAGEFLKRIAGRYAHVADPLNDAAGHFADCARHLKKVAELFSFPPQAKEIPEAGRTAGAGMLKDAAACEAKAVDAVLKACEVPWEIK